MGHEASAAPVPDHADGALRRVLESIARIEHLTAAGWTRRIPRRGDLTASMHLVPANRWVLGPDIPTSIELSESSGKLLSRRRTIELDSFWISDGPVTHLEYAEFVAAGGYHERSFWSAAGWDWRSRRDDVEQFVMDWAHKRDELRRHQDRIVRLVQERLASVQEAGLLVRFIELTDDDLLQYARATFESPIEAPFFWRNRTPAMELHPVVGISWHEANAFCVWKSQQLGFTVRLPTEDEWEAACAWRLSRVPLDGLINSLECGLHRTSPVGAFETGDEVGADIPKDLMGNCFEWTFDYYRPGEHVRRVVKGGSWRQERWRAHPAYRGRSETWRQADDLGFRYLREV